MNNNDPMKRFGYIVFSICLFALSACTSHEQMDQEEGIVKVSMGLTAASFTDDDATTRAEQPMAPDYENLISNLWILQFDREGILYMMMPRIYWRSIPKLIWYVTPVRQAAVCSIPVR